MMAEANPICAIDLATNVACGLNVLGCLITLYFAWQTRRECMQLRALRAELERRVLGRWGQP